MAGQGVSPIQPIYEFDDNQEFDTRHRVGTEKEFSNESSNIEAFNSERFQFRAWVIASLGQSIKKSHWLFLVAPGDKTEWRLPKEGETCQMKLLSKTGRTEKSDWCVAERIENPGASLGLSEEEYQSYYAFKVFAPHNAHIRPMLDEEEGEDAGPAQKPLKLWPSKAVLINLLLRLSTATINAELGALDTLVHDHKRTRTFKQQAAFQYLMNFKNPAFTIDLFYHFPHLKDYISNPHDLPQKLISFLQGFDEHQRIAYQHLLAKLPCGICIIPGGPGAGKTHWNLILTCAIQYEDLVVHGPESTNKHGAKVLYLLDIDKPLLDDIANKMMRLYKELGLKKKAIRLHSWQYGNQGLNPRFLDNFMIMARVKSFKRTGPATETNCIAPTLEEAVWEYYEQNKAGKYCDLAYYLATALRYGKHTVYENFKTLVNDLYVDTLNTIDFIATTTVSAATRLGGFFKPDIVIFDESPQARELSTLVAIANYEPLAWILSGDHRQTGPFVISDDPSANPFASQLLVSTMERAHRAGATKYSLLINHRAFAGLERLASSLFYNNAMVSGHKEDELFPPTARYLQVYLERFISGHKCQEPRIIVWMDNSGETQEGTGWYNQGHMTWVMQRALELLKDSMFQRIDKPERGTILIIVPYVEALHRYQQAIKQLQLGLQQQLNVDSRLEVRTIDTARGSEADVVFLDFVRHQGTESANHPHRLCVALTRARQAEIIMMNPGMCTKGRSSVPAVNLTRIWNHSARLGQIARIRRRGSPLMDKEWKPPIFPLPPGTPGIAIDIDSEIVDGMSKEEFRLTKPTSPAKMSQVPQTPVVEVSTPTIATGAIRESDTAVKPLQEEGLNKPVKEAVWEEALIERGSTERPVERAPVEEAFIEQTPNTSSWAEDEVCRLLDDLTRIVPERSLQEEDTGNLLGHLTRTVQEPHLLHADALRLDNTERPMAPVNIQIPEEPVTNNTKRIIAEKDALPSGSDWW